MARLRLVGLAGALFVAALAVGALALAGVSYPADGHRLVSTGAVFGFVAIVALAVVALGSGGARTRDTAYW